MPRNVAFLERPGSFNEVETARRLLLDWFDSNELDRLDVRPSVVRKMLVKGVQLSGA